MKNDNKPKKNLPIVIGIFAIFFLVLALFAGFANAPDLNLPSSPAQAVDNATDNISDTNVTRTGKPVFPPAKITNDNLVEE